jgi:ATP:ADP antiporter, AAA family
LASAEATSGPLSPLERRALFSAAGAYFCLMCGYYMLRPIREGMALQVGRENLPGLFTGVLIVALAVLPLYWWFVGRTPRRFLLLGIYGVFAVFFVSLAIGLAANPSSRLLAAIYFVAFAGVNLFVISVFWSSMADAWPSGAAKRFFGYVAGGGSAGALIGPTIVERSVVAVGPPILIVIACGLIALTIVLVAQARTNLSRLAGVHLVPDAKESVGGRAIDDLARLIKTPYLLGIAAIVIIGQIIGGLMYAEQAKYVSEAYATTPERTALFSRMEIAVNLLALFFQVVIVGWLTRRGSLGWSLSAMPVLIGATFVLLALFPIGAMLLVTQVIRRAADYGLGKPPREMLFTVVNPESKFKSKSLIDTVVQRGTDSFTQWMYPLVAGLGLAGIAWLCAAICFGLLGAARSLASGFENRAVPRGADTRSSS